MSAIQKGADRTPHDLSHFCFTSGAIGRLKVLDTVPVIAGDSIEINALGAMRLSPLRRGLAVDTKCDVFTFYMPHRFVYGNDVWTKFLKDGVAATPLPTIAAPAPQGVGSAVTNFLGVNPGIGQTIPKWLWFTYASIWNNYFKAPWMSDQNVGLTSLDSLPIETKYDGLQCCHLKTIWSAPLNPNTALTKNLAISGGNLDIMSLTAAQANLHTEQERTAFMQRYRDIVKDFGGKAPIDSDIRPQLLMRSDFWGSGYDVDGTDQSSLGQFSGRVQQSFQHQVPRFYVPEHGVLMTVMLVRFPPTCAWENHYLVNKGAHTYADLAGDPVVVGNYPPIDTDLRAIFTNSGYTTKLKLAQSQWYRYHPSRVDYRYNDLQGFPFLTAPTNPTSEGLQALVNSSQYDNVFQTLQLGQWNAQMKFNVTVYRSLPFARDSIMTN